MAFVMKPNPDGSTFEEIVSVLQAPIEFPEDFVSVSELQKRWDEVQPISERVGAGGRLISYRMRRSSESIDRPGITIETHVCHEFSDYQEVYDQARAQLDN